MNACPPRQWLYAVPLNDAPDRDTTARRNSAKLGHDTPARLRLFIGLFRRWAVARKLGENPLPAMFAINALATRTLAADDSPEWVPACDSYFALTEACIGRPLVHAAAESAAFTPDEIAIVEMLRQAPATGPLSTSQPVPHGLPGALLWAARSVLRAFKDDIRYLMALDLGSAAGCPFQPHNDTDITGFRAEMAAR